MAQGEPVAWHGGRVVSGSWGLVQLAMGDGRFSTGADGRPPPKAKRREMPMSREGGAEEKKDEEGDKAMGEDAREKPYAVIAIHHPSGKYPLPSSRAKSSRAKCPRDPGPRRADEIQVST